MATEPETPGVDTPSACPMCGTPVKHDASFCAVCDSLVERPLSPRPTLAVASVGGSFALPIAIPLPRPSSAGSRPPGAVAPKVSPPPEPPAHTIECWDCGTANPPSGAFCKACGVWIAIGGGKVSGAKSAAAKSAAATHAQPSSGRPPASGADASARPSDPHARTAPRPRPVDGRRRAIRRRRHLTVTLTLWLMAGIVGLAALRLLASSGDSEPGLMMAGAPALGPSPARASDPLPSVEPLLVLAATTESDATSPDASRIVTSSRTAGADGTGPGSTTSSGERVVAAASAVTAATRVDGLDEDRSSTLSLPSGGGAAAQSERGSRNGWVCDGSARIEDLGRSGWSVGRVTFRNAVGFERVTLDLERLGADGGAPASVTAEAFATSSLRQHFPRAAQPSGGRTTIGLRFEDGIRGLLGLRGYHPQDMDSLKEFSAYPAGDGSWSVLVTAAADGCFRLRVPAWQAGSTARHAQLHLDIRS
jgi:hypothetical protein